MKKHFILVFGFLLCGALQAQETGSYINFNVGGGLHNLSYNLQNGTQKGQFGYTLNAGYSYFFTPYWGLHTGLGFQSFNSLSTLNYLSSTPDIDSQGDSYLFKANYNNWQERQQVLFMDIPLTIQFKFPVTKKFGLLTSVGGQISIPVNTSFKTTGGEIVTTGYYEKWNVEMSGMPQHGFSTYNKEFNGKLSVKPSIMGIADLGGLYKLNEKLDLYVGGYINYGLNNILKTDSKLILQPNAPDGIYNGVLASSLTTSVTPVSVGVKVGVYWHLGIKKSTLDFNKPDESIQPVETVSPLQPTEEPVQVVPSTDPVPAVQPIELIQPTEPVQAVQPAEPVETTVAVVPVQTEPAIVPVQTIQPIEAVQPEPALVSVQSVQPIETVQTSQAVVPVQAAQSVEPLQTEPAIVPVQSVQPIQTVQPVQVSEPVPAIQPSEPVQTVQSVDQVQLIQATKPVEAIHPATETSAVNSTPKVTDTPRKVTTKTSVTPVSTADPGQGDNSYEQAQKIASEMNLMFGFNSFLVTNAKNDKIKQLSRTLKDNPYIHLRFVGHTCNIGTYAINLLLGLKRAVSAKQKFIEQGVPMSQLVSESKAYDEPLVPNTSKENRAKNRRVEIKVFR